MRFLYYIIFRLYILTKEQVAQMVERRAFDAHVLGSIPGVCILLFSYLFQANPMLHSLTRLPCNLNAHPLDALLARSNASCLNVLGAPQVNACT